MENTKIPKENLFDLILINTFKRCKRLIDYQKANNILSVERIMIYNSTDNYYSVIDPEDYKLSSIPVFSNQDKEILNKFYGVNLPFIIILRMRKLNK